MARWFFFVAVLAVFVSAYILPTEALDVFYWATPDSVKVVGADGRVLWSTEAVFPLIATDAAGRCLAVANRLYMYEIVQQRFTIERSLVTEVELSPYIVESLAQYGIRIPRRVSVEIDLSIPLPPLVFVSLDKTTVVSLHAPYGYPHWGVSLGRGANVTAIATSCEYVVVGTMSGEIYVVRDGRVVDQFLLEASPPAGPSVTAMAIDRSGRVAYVGTADGGIYRFRLPTGEELRSGRFDRGLTRLARCGGAVYGLYTTPRGDAVALCFNMTDRPYVRVWPFGLVFPDPVLALYGIDTPRVVSAMSQDGRWLYVAVGSGVVGVRDGRVAWTYPLPAKPMAIATSWNGSIVAVGTLAGHFYIFKDGVPVVRTDPVSTQLLIRAVGGNVTGNFTLAPQVFNIKPVSSVASSFDGQVVAFENWDSVSILFTARLPYRVEADDVCLPLEAAVVAEGSDVAYFYTLYRRGELYVPYGRVSIMPLYRYMGDVRCRPERNFTLTIFGDVAEPLVLRYELQYRVYRQPPELVVGPDWAAGPTRYSARPSPPVQLEVEIEGLDVLRDWARVDPAVLQRLVRVVLDGWEVDGRRIGAGIGVVTVDVQRPTYVKAIYRVSFPRLFVDRDAGVKLANVLLYDSYGNIIDVGLEPRFDVYPVFAYARYVPVFRVSVGRGALVNGTEELWAEYGSTVVFEAVEYIDFGNGTRGVFTMWRETRSTARVVVETVREPIKLTPVFLRHYLVAVSPPARIEGANNMTWVREGDRVVVVVPVPIEERAGVRTVLKNWVINGVPNATLTAPRLELIVRRPLNISLETKRQYLVTLTSAYGSVPSAIWVDEGGLVAVVPTPTEVWSPPPLRFNFVGWRDVATGVVYRQPQLPVVYGPTTLEAVWELDPLPLLAIAGAAAAGVFLFIFFRRRRVAKLLAEAGAEE
ncbi:MAG: hypothetical protein QXE80_06800 [Pyrobaculum sp.]